MARTTFSIEKFESRQAAVKLAKMTFDTQFLHNLEEHTNGYEMLVNQLRRFEESGSVKFEDVKRACENMDEENDSSKGDEDEDNALILSEEKTTLGDIKTPLLLLSPSRQLDEGCPAAAMITNSETNVEVGEGKICNVQPCMLLEKETLDYLQLERTHTSCTVENSVITPFVATPEAFVEPDHTIIEPVIEPITSENSQPLEFDDQVGLFNENEVTATSAELLETVATSTAAPINPQQREPNKSDTGPVKKYAKVIPVKKKKRGMKRKLRYTKRLPQGEIVNLKTTATAMRKYLDSFSVEKHLILQANDICRMQKRCKLERLDTRGEKLFDKIVYHFTSHNKDLEKTVNLLKQRFEEEVFPFLGNWEARLNQPGSVDSSFVIDLTGDRSHGRSGKDRFCCCKACTTTGTKKRSSQTDRTNADTEYPQSGTIVN